MNCFLKLDDYDITMNNLKLLNFDFNKFEKEKGYLYTKQSFLKPNNNAMYTIIFFLLTNIDKNLSEQFTFCYPATSIKELKDFKEISFTHIKKLENSGMLPKDTILGKSVLDNPCGDRFVYLIRVLSDCALLVKLREIKPNLKLPMIDLVDINNTNIINNSKKAMMTHISLQKNKFLETSKELNNIQTQWKNFASSLTKDLEELEKEKEILEKKLKKLQKTIDTSVLSEIAAIDRDPKLENYKIFLNLTNKLSSTFEKNTDFTNNLNYLSNTDNIFDSVNQTQLFQSTQNQQTNDSINLNISSINQTQQPEEIREKDYSLFIVQEKLKVFNRKISEASNKLKEVKTQKKTTHKTISDLSEMLDLMTEEHISILEKLEDLKKKVLIEKQ